MTDKPREKGSKPGAAILSGRAAAPLAPAGDPRFDMALGRIGFSGMRNPAVPPMRRDGLASAPAGPSKSASDKATPLALARRDWLMDVMERQRRLSAYAGGMLRWEKPSAAEFLDRVYAPGRPAVIAGAIDHWPALGRWTPDHLRAAVGDAPVEFQGGRSGAGDFELMKDRHKQVLPFSAYLDLIEGHPGNDAYVTAYNSDANRAAFAPLMADTGSIDCCLGPGEGMLWVGPAETFTPLHFDLTNNLLVQITGRKRILLVPPAQTRWLYHDRHVFSAVHDLEDQARLARYPLARQVTPYVVTLAPGEALFIPIGWWHQVRALDFSVMMTCTNFLWPNDGFQDFPGD